MFPARIAQTKDGQHAFDYTITDAQPNGVNNLEVPAAAAREERVEPQQFAPGIWYLAGGAVNSTLVDFDRFVAVVETGANLARARATIAQVRKMTDKPIVHVNSHHHVDHWSGLRDWIMADATIITHEMNRGLYEQVLKNPYTLAPDDFSRNPKPAKFEFVKDRHTLTDGRRTMEIYWIEGNLHAANMLMSYLPNEKLLIVTDIFNMFYEPRSNDPPDGFASPYTMNLWDNIQRLKLDVRFIAPGHGREVVPASELTQKVVGRKVLNPQVQ
jgi:glyoxylase-like metal-dependent hydrolase (beta-lactamase superfamily II)